MAESKYGKYIITEMKPDVILPEFRKKAVFAPDEATFALVLDDDVVKGSLYVECAWFWKLPKESIVPTHSHDFNEIFGFFGTNAEDWRDLGGEVEFYIDGEKHMLNKSCLVFIPKGLKHCPMEIKRVDRPIFHFIVGTKGTYK